MVPWSEQVCAENIVEYWPGMNIAVPKPTSPISEQLWSDHGRK